MFVPKHTLESVTRELIEGLETGTIGVRSDEAPKLSVKAFQAAMEEATARSRRIERRFLATICSFNAGILCSLIISAVMGLWTTGEVVLVLCLAWLVIPGLFIILFRVHARTVELKTYLQVLKLADEVTAERLLIRLAPRLPQIKQPTH